jgi:signal transduction histidine kinase
LPDLLAYDGARLVPWSLPKPEVSLGPVCSAVYSAQNGDFWLGGPKGVACIHEGKWRSFVTSDDTAPNEVVDFAELADGKIWCATAVKIWEFDGRKWSALHRGFESINRLQRTRDGSVWVASNNALNRYFQGNWIENGVEDGLPSVVIRDLSEDSLGHLWAVTARGISQFHPEADPEPPHTSVKFDQAGEPRIEEGGSLNAVFSAVDKWKFTSRGRLLYSHRLDANDWTPFWEVSFFSGADLSPGKHFLQVRSMDRNGNIDPSPAHINFMVVQPWYRESRLLFISAAALVVALFFAGLAVNRHRRLVRSYAEIEIKVAERTRQLETANRELMHSQKMNALGTLAAGIAHDFNNILSIIKGSAQIIEANLDDPQKVSTRLDRIKTVVEQGAGIVKAMLGFSRDSEEPIKPEDINGAVEDTLKLLGDRFLREIKVLFEAGKDLPQVACSKDFIQQILLNFIFNAAESVLSRNEIILSTFATKELPLEVVLAPDRAEDYVCLQVKDFGSGIPRENLTRIFEPFFTTKALSARRGTGLGLSMVYELAKKVKAGIAVQSEVGVGSAFILIIPTAKVKTQAQPLAGKSIALARL